MGEACSGLVLTRSAGCSSLPTWLIFTILSRLLRASLLRDRRPEVCELLPGLFVGEYPRLEDIAWLHDEFGIGAVLSLQDDDDLTLHQLSLPVLDAAYAQHRIAFCRVPVADFNCQSLAASLSQALDALAQLCPSRPVGFCALQRGL